MKASASLPGPTQSARPKRRDSSATQAMPLGTAVYDADVQQRAERVVAEVIDTLPDFELHTDRLTRVIERALVEQDRASRADELLRRFSPSVQQYVRRHTSATS